jgi:glycosyltransferase involved in cell wall biosynthesis
MSSAVAVLVNVWPKLSETFILEEVLALERRGVSMLIYTLSPESDELRHDDVAQVKAPVAGVPPLGIASLHRHLKAHFGAVLRHPWGWLQALSLAWRRGSEGWHDFLRAAWLAQRLRHDGATCLHVHFIARPADVAEMAALMSGLPLSISAHAKDIYLSRPQDLQRKLMAARFTVTCTGHNQRTLAQIAPDAVVRRMHHGINHQQFHAQRQTRSPDRPTCILAVGRLKAKKGLDVLIEACRLMHARGRNIQCLIVGYGEAADALKAQIHSAGLNDVVQLLGKLPRHSVIEWYARADVFVQPSRIMADGDRDGIPNVMLEAMSMALPVIASKVSGIPEVIEHQGNGLLVEPDDPVALANGIEHLLDDREAAAAMGAQARATVMRHFDNDTNLGLLLDLMGSGHECHHQTCTA